MYRRVVAVPDPQPPTLFRLAGHSVRWALLCALARGDHRVRELTASVGLPQNLVSYHLGRLRAAGVVASRRSSADGRDAYYRLDLDRCRELLNEAGVALHPGLAAGPDVSVRTGLPRRRVLFLCTGNSARSQMAEALIEQLSGGAVDAASAGSRPKPLHPSAVRVMAARGVDISARSSKHLDTFRQARFDDVISLCDRVREVCPDFLGGPRTIHWSIPDPAAEPADPTDPDAAFARAADELEVRIRFLLHELRSGASPMEVTAE
jgi:protein-tyrosine-phosphatase/DNA-binding transcriptional ArsR family regulator